MMMSTEAMKALLKERGKLVESYLATCLDGQEMPPRLRESMLYSLQAGGKRLRPVLCLSCAALCGLQPAAVLPFASAIEMVHTYSLIHDDLPAMMTMTCAAASRPITRRSTRRRPSWPGMPC